MGRSGLRPTRCDLWPFHPISGETVRWWDVLWHLQAFQALGRSEPAGPGRGRVRVGQEQHRYCRGCLGGKLRGRRDQPFPEGRAACRSSGTSEGTGSQAEADSEESTQKLRQAYASRLQNKSSRPFLISKRIRSSSPGKLSNTGWLCGDWQAGGWQGLGWAGGLSLCLFMPSESRTRWKCYLFKHYTEIPWSI